MSSYDNENILDKFNKVLNTAKNSIGQIQEVIVEKEEFNNINDLNKLKCLNKQIMNFDLLEEDVKHIHNQLKAENHTIIGTYLVINIAVNRYEVSLENYFQKDNENFKDSNNFKASRIEHLPSDIAEELKQNGKVKLHLEV